MLDFDFCRKGSRQEGVGMMTQDPTVHQGAVQEGSQQASKAVTPVTTVTSSNQKLLVFLNLKGKERKRDRVL